MTTTVVRPDPIDQLIPAPRPAWARLVVGLVIVVTIGFGSALVGFGYVYPRPECCGSGSGSAQMLLSPDGEAVVVTAYFFNSSGRDLEITSASARLPGARVVGIAFVDQDEQLLPLVAKPFPAMIGGTGMGRIAITFIPETCVDDGRPWGSVDVHLDVVNRWLPSIDRTYRLPDPVVGVDSLAVFPPS
ncbi:MAG: hypothetical protein HZB15_00360 [Actinobacteria bacterium]|nr:hypothetical protein [Actinomycetota bacterium]